MLDKRFKTVIRYGESRVKVRDKYGYPKWLSGENDEYGVHYIRCRGLYTDTNRPSRPNIRDTGNPNMSFSCFEPKKAKKSIRLTCDRCGNVIPPLTKYFHHINFNFDYCPLCHLTETNYKTILTSCDDIPTQPIIYSYNRIKCK